jgi:hypothetical protein
MSDSFDRTPATGRGQGYGCLGLALFSLLGTALFVILGIRCLQKHELFDCIGLLTVFPAAFATIGLTSAAIGLQRFTTAGRRQGLADRLAGLESGWQPVQPVQPFQPRVRQERWITRPLNEVIHLPGRQDTPEEGSPPPKKDEAE